MTKSAFRFLLGLSLCLIGSGFAFAAPVAYMHEVTGVVQAQYGSRAPQNLKIGDTIDSGAVLITGDGSSGVVKFEDGQIVVLLPKTRFAIANYQFNTKQAKDSDIAFRLLQGGLRFITGVIGSTNHSAFRMTAGTATIGIRGSDITTVYDAIANIVTVAVNEGAAELANAQGIQTVLAGNFSSAIGQQTPSVQQAINNLPQALQQVVQRAASVPVPSNTPVVIPLMSSAAKARAEAFADPSNKDKKDAADAALNRAIEAAQAAFISVLTPDQLQQLQNQLQQQGQPLPATGGGGQDKCAFVSPC